MHHPSLRTFLLVLLLFSSALLAAENKAFTEINGATVPLVSVEKTESGWMGTIAWGRDQGVIDGSHGWLSHLNASGVTSLGECWIKAVNEKSATVLIRPNQGESATVGDLISVPLRVQRGVHRGKILSIAKQGIVLNKQYKDGAYVSMDVALGLADEQEEEKVLAEWVEEVHGIADRIAGKEQGQTPIASGRFSGTMEQALRKTAVADIKEFLEFVSDFPGRYFGRSFKGAETYATWAMNGAPPSKAAVARRSRIMSEEEFAAYLAREVAVNKFEVAPDDWADTVIDEATDDSPGLAGDIRLERALAKAQSAPAFEAIALTAEGLRDFYRSRRKREDVATTAKALQPLSKALEIAAKLQNSDEKGYWQAWILRHRAEAYASLSDYNAASRDADAALKLLDPKQDSHAILIFDVAPNSGEYHLKKGEYELAKAAYENALAMSRRFAGMRTLRMEVRTINALADIAAERGDAKGAVENREKAIELATRYGVDDLMRSMKIKLGFEYFRVGAFDKCEAHFKKLLQIAKEQDDLRLQTYSLSHLGEVAGATGRIAEADAYYAESLKLAEKDKDPETAAEIREDWALELWAVGRAEDALNMFREASRVYENQPEEYALILTFMGDSLRALHRYAEAEQVLKKAIALDQLAGMQGRLDYALTLLADVLSYENRPAEARELIEKTFARQKAAGNTSGIIRSLLNLAGWHSHVNELGKARAEAEEALQLARNSGDAKLEIEAIQHLVSYYSSMGENVRSEELIRTGLENAKRRNDRIKQELFVRMLGERYIQLHRFAEARAQYQEAEAISLTSGMRTAVATNEVALGSVDLAEGNIEGCRKHLEKAREYAGKMTWGNAIDMLEIDLLIREGKRREVIDKLREQDKLALASAAINEHLDILDRIGDLQLQQNEYEAALATFDELVKDSGENVLVRIAALKSRASALAGMGQYSKADESLAEAIKSADRDQTIYSMALRVQRARMLIDWARRTNDMQMAAQRVDDATRLLNEIEPQARQKSRRLLLDIVMARSSRATLLSPVTGRQLATTVEPLPTAEGAAQPEDEAVQIATEMHLKAARQTALFLRGSLRYGKDDIENAVADLDASMKLLLDQALQYAVVATESTGSLYQADDERVFTTLLTVYERKHQQLSERLLQINSKMESASDPSLVKEFAEDAKAIEADIAQLHNQSRNVLESMRRYELLTSSSNIHIPEGSTEANKAALHYQTLFRQQIELENRLAEEYRRPEGQVREEVIQTLGDRLAQNRDQINAEAKLIEAQYPELAKELQLGVDNLTQFAQERLNDEEALIEPVIVPGRLIVFVARNVAGQASIHSFSSELSSDEVGDKLRTIWKAVSTPTAEYSPESSAVEGSSAAIAAELYDRLFAPAEPALANAKTLLISATGPLRYVPFHVLLAPSQDGKRVFLNDRFNIVYLTRSGSISNYKPIKYVNSPMLAVAVNPPEAPLPETEQEVSSIQTIWKTGKGPFELRRNREATVAGVNTTIGRLSSINRGGNLIFHIATHGESGSVPADSYLLFADDKLRQDEIRHKLTNVSRASMAVLSGCKTALGNLDSRGRGVTGLAYEFESIGVRTVIATLWKLDSETGRDFMTDFYKQLAAGQEIGSAVREARSHIRNNPKTAHPYYWAPFVVIGQWR